MHVCQGASCDIFISYRQKGGSDFAQLLKVCFKSMGLEVYMDPNALAPVNLKICAKCKRCYNTHLMSQDEYRQQVIKMMAGAKNVLLVWTKGCMDRFLDDADPTNQGDINKQITYFHIAECAADCVRMEYALALKLNKNIIPVAHEEFDWPDGCRFPEDCAVMGLNAVKYARNLWIVAMILLNCSSRLLNAVLLLGMCFASLQDKVLGRISRSFYSEY